MVDDASGLVNGTAGQTAGRSGTEADGTRIGSGHAMSGSQGPVGTDSRRATDVVTITPQRQQEAEILDCAFLAANDQRLRNQRLRQRIEPGLSQKRRWS